jgi:syntaxin 1B/2/3
MGLPTDLLRSDQPAPQPTYPPPSNGVAGRTPNQYAQQDNSYNQYGAPQNYGQNAANPYAQQQYGQQEQYAMGGQPGGGEDFWSELSATNSLLSQLQEQIQAVRSAHQQSLVRAGFCSFSGSSLTLALRPRPTRKLPHMPTS